LLSSLSPLGTQLPVIKQRQDKAVAAGAAVAMTEVLLGVHQEDKETCLRTTQCVMAVAINNPPAIEAFKAAGMAEAMEAVVEKHGETNPGFKKCQDIFI
jgi:hypothetical protein